MPAAAYQQKQHIENTYFFAKLLRHRYGAVFLAVPVEIVYNACLLDLHTHFNIAISINRKSFAGSLRVRRGGGRSGTQVEVRLVPNHYI